MAAEGAVRSPAIVEVEPACERGGSFVTRAIDAPVGPTVEQRADEPLRLPIGLRTARTGAQVPDAERSAGDRVHRRAIGGSVVGEHTLDGDAVSGVEAQSSPQETDRCAGALISQHLDVGQAAEVVDRDVAELPADSAATGAPRPRSRVVVLAAGDAVAGAALDPPELLDVDVDELARA
jgi:hypothetical protein